eukprot:CAMPEP_0172543642 /NCGR_PEP_ID=MMETSP1067-20121228/13982_1 /TAXON_ID=265564 ORGANISM="Thalassiosira punctigera, Strain Tpunct2005C2" /NCGR_SAMPLE_ID=MMETSP1067 /ASSEMBLY_ACC=CAM_ASM_000444 /LENGTH=517 /DNA_ID=CAMNT_0013330093 /DNA_START=178 /DNA_END=1728 /DNA_ORIENTATION=+
MCKGEETVKLDHESVLKRLEEVASAEYPYPRPEFIKPKDGSERIHLTSSKNLRPVLISMALFLGKLIRPHLTILFGILAYFFRSAQCATVAVLCAGWVWMDDPFFLHHMTDGRLGGLGGGGRRDKIAKDGFFCKDSPRNDRVRDVLAKFVGYRPTSYFCSGDLLTLMPFLLFKGSKGGKVPYKRYWVRVPAAPAPDGDDGPAKRPAGDNTDEAVALDVVFPSKGYRADKPTFLVLHGLNGGSTEPYVLDLARRATKEGHAFAVMVNRGLMKTPLRGNDSFHGARTSDVGCAVDALLHALRGESTRQSSPVESKIVMVGFSMGGIIAANYTAKSKGRSGLAGAVCFSGTLCSEKMLVDCPAAKHSLSVWQPALAWGLKATIIKPQMPRFARNAGITPRQVEDARTVVDIDSRLVCACHKYAEVRDYYEDMSAGGRGDDEGIQRLRGAAVPLLAVHAIDDPIAIYEVALADEIPKTENVMLLATKHGGHIGWPTGMFPSVNRWGFMMDVAMDFAAAIVS